MKNLLLSSLLFASLSAFHSIAQTVSVPSNPEDSLSMRTGMMDWIDPVKATPINTNYTTYPTPQRGEGTYGSFMIYLPDAYLSENTREFPVIYYLHGGTGNQREATWMIESIDKAIKTGKMNPVIVVSPQALPIGWYVNANISDSKVTSGPIADILTKDLIPFVDRHYRTVDNAYGRGIEGFSMGGRGAFMLAFRHPDLFGAASSIAGALVDWEEEPLQRALECTFGDVDNKYSKIYFDSWHPRTFACNNVRDIIGKDMKIRMFVGDKDRLFEENGAHMTQRFHELLDTLRINHTFEITPGAGHNPEEIFDPSKREYDTTFWDNAFTKVCNDNKDTTQTPLHIKEFVDNNFPDLTISRVKTIPDVRGNHFEVLLNDGTFIKFNERYNWITVDKTIAPGYVPQSMIHQGINDYISVNNDHEGIVMIEKIPKVGYRVSFSDGSQKTFNTEGILI